MIYVKLNVEMVYYIKHQKNVMMGI